MDITIEKLDSGALIHVDGKTIACTSLDMELEVMVVGIVKKFLDVGSMYYQNHTKISIKIEVDKTK